jgi:phosphoribosylglycinamide formyltransferase-1
VYKNRIINFHPSILPAYLGLKSIDQAISDKANLLGNTVHFISSGVDTGSIILHSVIPAVAFDEGGYDAILDIQIDMLYKVLIYCRQQGFR